MKHSHFRKQTTRIVALLVLTACGNDKQAQADEQDTLLNVTRGRIKAILDATPDCAAVPEDENCRPTKVSSKEFRFNWPQINHNKVLIIESGNLPLTSLGKYGNRVFLRVKADQTGTFRETEASTTMAAGLKKIYLGEFGKLTTHLRASDFQDLTEEMDKFKPSLDQISYDHGHLIQSYIAENAPNSAFMLANYPYPPREDLCEKNTEKLQDFYQSAGDSLAQMIRTQDVRFINLSAGETIKTIGLEFNHKCPGNSLSHSEAEQILAAASRFYKAIASVNTALLVQAGMVSSGSFSVQDYNIDCDTASYPNRIRVGFYFDPNSSAPISGGSWDEFGASVPAGVANAKQCLDIFVNSGHAKDYPHQPGEFASRVTGLGLGEYDFPIIATSFAAPIATTGLLRIAEKFDNLPAQKLVENMVLQYGKSPQNSFYDFIRYFITTKGAN